MINKYLYLICCLICCALQLNDFVTIVPQLLGSFETNFTSLVNDDYGLSRKTNIKTIICNLFTNVQISNYLSPVSLNSSHPSTSERKVSEMPETRMGL